MALQLGCQRPGYYGPTKPHGMHVDYEYFETPEEAQEAFNKHWRDADKRNVTLCYWKDGWGPLTVSDYCEERESLPEIYAALEKANLPLKFIECVGDVLNLYMAEGYWEIWQAMTMAPRLQVIAALQAFGKWPEEWQLEMDVEEDSEEETE